MLNEKEFAEGFHRNSFPNVQIEYWKKLLLSATEKSEKKAIRKEIERLTKNYKKLYEATLKSREVELGMKNDQDRAKAEHFLDKDAQEAYNYYKTIKTNND